MSTKAFTFPEDSVVIEGGTEGDYDPKEQELKQPFADIKWDFCFSTELWKTYKDNRIQMQDLKCIKYFEEGVLAEKNIKMIPKKVGGIYFYVIKNPIIPDYSIACMYVGRARYTKYENLRQRARSHYADYKKRQENERLIRLFDIYKDYVYYLFLPIQATNDEIDDIEDRLINALTLPCNKEYPSVSIRRTLSMYNYS